MRQFIPKRLIAATFIVAAVTVGAVALDSASGGDPPPGLSLISNRGVAVTPNVAMEATLHNTVGSGNPVELGQRQGVTFYRIDGSKRGNCYGLGHGTGVAKSFDLISCGRDFPSVDQPVADASVVQSGPDQPAHLTQVQGWAADGVATIAAVDASGAIVAQTAVVDNLYRIDSDSLGQTATRLEARDTSGSVVYSADYRN